MKQIYPLRLNLADEEDRRAYGHLCRMKKKQDRSYGKAIIAVMNNRFERQKRLAEKLARRRTPFFCGKWKQSSRGCNSPRSGCSNLPNCATERCIDMP